MTPKIKQRIEQIQNGEVPKGYKQTPFGIYPANWVVGKLGDYIEEYSVLSNEIETYPVYSSSRKGLLPQSQYFDNREAVTTNLGYKMVPSGYVTYRHMSDDDIFYFNRNTTGKTILVSGEYPVFTNSEYGCLDYLITLLNSTARFRYFCRTQKMGGTRTRLYFKRLCQYRAAFPHISEQLKIAEILNTQDRVIELTEKHIEQLKQMKKYYLQNMFPKHGEKVPKLRFKGFTDDLEQCKLGDISDSYSGGTPTAGKTEYYGGDIPFIRSAEVNSDSTELFLTEEGLKKSSAKMVNRGDILYALYGATSGEVGLARLNGAINQAILDIKPHVNYDARFIMQWLRKSKETIIATYLQGGQGNLSGTIVTSLVIGCPTYNEQKKIGDLFAVLDNIITLHQRKLEEEKQKKKSLAQLLLSGIVRV